MTKKITTSKRMKMSRSILVITGAGISVSAGIPYFRSHNTGIYSLLSQRGYSSDPQELFDTECFKEDPQLFYSFAKELLPLQPTLDTSQALGNSSPTESFHPTPTHRFLRALEMHGALMHVYTQNIDGLEDKVQLLNYTSSWNAHKRPMFEMQKGLSSADTVVFYCQHERQSRGKSSRATTQSPAIIIPSSDGHNNSSNDSNNSNNSYNINNNNNNSNNTNNNSTVPTAPIITCGGVVKKLKGNIERAWEKHPAKCELLLVIGSSLAVNPVRQFIEKIPKNVTKVLINKEPIQQLESSDIFIQGLSDSVSQQLIDILGWGI